MPFYIIIPSSSKNRRWRGIFPFSCQSVAIYSFHRSSLLLLPRVRSFLYLVNFYYHHDSFSSLCLFRGVCVHTGFINKVSISSCAESTKQTNRSCLIPIFHFHSFSNFPGKDWKNNHHSFMATNWTKDTRLSVFRRIISDQNDWKRVKIK